MKTSVFFVVALLFTPEFQDKNKVTDKEIDQAIAKGVKWLTETTEKYLNSDEKKHKDTLSHMMKKSEEIILYTFVHAGKSDKDETFKKLLDKVLAVKPKDKQTYNVALEILALVALDPSKYQGRIAQCAQVLVNTQNKNGGWSYGAGLLTKKHKDLETDDTRNFITNDKKGQLREIIVKRERWCEELMNDNSNSQYAALGLRAAFEANVKVEREVLELAKKYFEKCQNSDGGWEYPFVDNSGNNGTGLNDPKKNVRPEKSYGSMTVGGLSSLTGYKFILKEDIKKDKYVQKAVEWLTKNFAVEKIPNPNSNRMAHTHYHYYYLYGLERAGAMAEITKFGAHDWYQEGAFYIIKHQREDGHWSGLQDTNDAKDIKTTFSQFEAVDTCFAILFLKKATEHLFETGK